MQATAAKVRTACSAEGLCHRSPIANKTEAQNVESKAAQGLQLSTSPGQIFSRQIFRLGVVHEVHARLSPGRVNPLETSSSAVVAFVSAIRKQHKATALAAGSLLTRRSVARRQHWQVHRMTYYWGMRPATLISPSYSDRPAATRLRQGRSLFLAGVPLSSAVLQATTYCLPILPTCHVGGRANRNKPHLAESSGVLWLSRCGILASEVCRHHLSTSGYFLWLSTKPNITGGWCL